MTDIRFSDRTEQPGLIVLDNGRPSDKGRGYVFNDDLQAAVEVALELNRPLLVAGEPGCGKTELGYAIARRMGIGQVHSFSTKSTAEARDLFYTYDAIGRFRDAQLAEFRLRQNPSEKLPGAGAYIEYQALGRAILDAHPRVKINHLLAGQRFYKHAGPAVRSVVVIDEIDKAPRDFPNDLLREIEDLSFRVPELVSGGTAETPDGTQIPGGFAPIVVVTSNEEKQLPDAFLRRCLFHELEFPEGKLLARIVASGLRKRAAQKGVDLSLAGGDIDNLIAFLLDFRGLPLEKRPGISELIDAATLIASPAPAAAPPFAARMAKTISALAKLKNDRLEWRQLALKHGYAVG